jgi:hypothetical protein
MTTVPAIVVSKTAEDANRAAAGFLARYGGPTRRAYGTDLRAWFAWCRDRRLEVLEVMRPHVELWVRAMEEHQHLSSSTVSRRLSTVSGYYRFAVIDGYIDRTPTEFVRRPHRDTESTTLGLDRMELGAFIAQGAAAGVTDHAWPVCLACSGFGCQRPATSTSRTWVSSAATARSTSSAKATSRRLSHCHLGWRGPWTRPPAGASRAHCSSAGPVAGWTASEPRGSCAASPSGPGSASASRRTRSVTASSPPASTPASRSATSRSPLATPPPGRRLATTGHATTSTVTPPTSSRHSWPERRSDNRTTSGTLCASSSRRLCDPVSHCAASPGSIPVSPAHGAKRWH